jgi:hypothetical protein
MLRAIDIQQVLVQSNSTERVQQTLQQHPEQQQRYLDIQMKEEKKISKETVKNADEPEHARIQDKKDNENAGRHASEQRRGCGGGNEQETQPEDDEHGGIIDIRV